MPLACHTIYPDRQMQYFPLYSDFNALSMPMEDRFQLTYAKHEGSGSVAII